MSDEPEWLDKLRACIDGRVGWNGYTFTLIHDTIVDAVFHIDRLLEARGEPANEKPRGSGEPLGTSQIDPDEGLSP